MNKARSIKYSVLVLLLFLVASLAITSWGFFSQSGSRFAVDRIQQALEDASYEYEAGNLASGLSLKNVRWQLKNGTTVFSNELTLTWDPWCWRSRQVCIKEAHADTLTIDLVRPKIIRNPIVPITVSIPLELSAKALKIDRLVINRPHLPAIELGNIDFNGTFEGTTIQANKVSARWQSLNASLSGEISLTDNYPLSANGLFSVQKSPASPAYAGQIDLHGDLLNAIVDIDLRRPWPGHIAGTVSAFDRRLPVNLSATWKEITLPISADNPAINFSGGSATISGTKPDYLIAAKADVKIQNLPEAKASVRGTINKHQLDFDHLALSTLDGMIDASGSFNYSQGLSWQSAVTLTGVHPHQHWKVPDSVASGNLQFNGAHHNGAMQLDFSALDVSGQSGNHPFIITGQTIQAPGDQWQFNQFEIQSSRNSVKANGTLSNESDLSLNFTLREPGLFKPGLRGDIYGAFTITGDRAQPNIDGVARSAQLIYKDLKIASSSLNTSIRDGGNQPGEIVFSADAVNLPHTSLNDVSLSLRGTRDSHSISAGFSNDAVQIDNTRLNGALDPHYNWSGKLVSVTGTIDDSSLQLINTFDLTWINTEKSMAVEPNCWSVNGTYGCIDEPALIGKTGALSFHLDGLDLNALTSVLPESVIATGALHSRGKLNWSPREPISASVYARVTDGTLSAKLPAAVQPLQVNLTQADLNVRTSRGRLKSALHLTTDKTGDLKASVDIDLTRKNYPATGVLSLGSTSLNLLRQYYPDLSIDKGTISGELLANGALNRPEISGLIKINNASYASGKLPLPLDNIDLDVSLIDDQFRINGNADSEGIPISLSGKASVNKQSWQADFNVQAEKLKFKHEYVKSAVVSPDLNISLTPKRISIDGNVWLQDASIAIPKLDNVGVPLSDDIVIVDAAAKDPTPFSSQKSQAIYADIDVQVGRNVYFEGYGLNAELVGQTSIKLQPQRTPELLGVIDVQNGTYRSYGQSLIIREGRISVVGPVEQTSLSVEAIRNTGNITAGIRIDGTLHDPQTTLFSDPPMPEEHILPYVVLGRPLDFGSSTDDSQLIANAALFMGISNGRGLTQGLAANLGIQDFTMNATGSGEDTQVQLSGRLNDRLLVRYGLGVFNSVNTLFLRYDLAEKLYLETTQGLEKAVDVFYSFEFD
ncbi:MAG: translocation/assembly module TamB domain-containing protein [Pseudomonadota bacterium]